MKPRAMIHRAALDKKPSLGVLTMSGENRPGEAYQLKLLEHATKQIG
jgi:hypothetical protein